MNRLKTMLILLGLLATLNVNAAANVDVNTPGVQAIVKNIQTRHAQLFVYLDSAAIGLSIDGLVELHDPGAVPIVARQKVNALIVAENNDRDALYAEIANANGHPEWKAEISNIFARRWIQHAHRGWWVMSNNGWIQK
jgi:uncharacterized protein YdbL (DUF1318 family)